MERTGQKIFALFFFKFICATEMGRFHLNPFLVEFVYFLLVYFTMRHVNRSNAINKRSLYTRKSEYM